MKVGIPFMGGGAPPAHEASLENRFLEHEIPVLPFEDEANKQREAIPWIVLQKFLSSSKR